MKHLYLVRHAKSSWDSSAASDFDRPLNDRGASDAPKMAMYLKENGIVPDLIFCSAAVRTHKTAMVIAKGLGLASDKIMPDRRLYMADVNHVQSLMREFSDEWNCVYVVGHNPTITECANSLSGDSLENIPTCGVYAMELDIDSWRKLRPGIAKKVFFQAPKLLS
jgi:phosphohistidine phosphatase